MKGSVFYKLTGSGNDFVFFDGRNVSADTLSTEAIRRICDRRRGVGADGLVVIEPADEPDTVSFQFFNSDGSEAPMCGNGALCATRLAAGLRMAPGSSMRLMTGSGPYETRCPDPAAERAEMFLADVAAEPAPAIEVESGEESIDLLHVGVPHVVVRVEDVDRVDVQARGSEIRHHRVLQPGGANVNFVSESNGEWRMRTYERGVEAETQACGTGAVACAAVLSSAGAIKLPWVVRSASGLELQVRGEPGSAERPSLCRPGLTGEARLLFRGLLNF